MEIEYDLKCPVPTVEHNGASLMISGCFSCNDVGNLCLIENMMDQEIPQKNLLQSSKKFGLENTLVVQQDNARKYTARID